MKKPILAITGLSGFLGRSMLASLVKKYQVIDLYNKHQTIHPLVESHQVDLYDTFTIIPKLRAIKPDRILHMAALTHIDRCEADKLNNKEGAVWKINVLATEQIAQYSQETNTHLTFLSTECVFAGTKEQYFETDIPNPKNWYGTTKYQSEKYLATLSSPTAIVRAVIAYNAAPTADNLYGYFCTQFKAGVPFQAVSDQTISPTHTDSIFTALDAVLQETQVGIFHMAPSDSLSPYQFAQLVAEKNSYDANLVQPASMLEFFGKKRATLRLQHAVLNCEKTNEFLGISPQTVSEIFATM